MTRIDPDRDLPGSPQSLPPRFWPPGRRPKPGERIETHCPGCGDPWEIHESLAGHRLRCACGTWIEVPASVSFGGGGGRGGGGRFGGFGEEGVDRAPPVPAAALLGADDLGSRNALPARRHKASLTSAKAGGRLSTRRRGADALDVHAPRKAGALRHGAIHDRQRWINRVVLEIAFIVGAFAGPSLAIRLLLGTEAWYRLLPIAELGAGLLVAGLCLSSAHYGFGALRAAAARYVGEAFVVGVLFAAAAVAYSHLLQGLGHGQGESFLANVREALGLPWTLLLVAAFPAAFEEIAFRGLVQERLTVLCGQKQGIILSGIAFALAHGVSAGFPFHVALGFYLGWLRSRSRSVLPGMTTHLVYNAVLILATT